MGGRIGGPACVSALAGIGEALTGWTCVCDTPSLLRFKRTDNFRGAALRIPKLSVTYLLLPSGGSSVVCCVSSCSFCFFSCFVFCVLCLSLFCLNRKHSVVFRFDFCALVAYFVFVFCVLKLAHGFLLVFASILRCCVFVACDLDRCVFLRARA